MCEALTPIDELRNLKWSVIALANADRSPGSYGKENADNAARGIQCRLDWIIEQLTAAGEGKRNLYNASTGKIEPLKESNDGRQQAETKAESD